MPRKAIMAADSFADFRFPVKGLDLSKAYSMQRKDTTPSAANVRAFDPATNRARGAARPGLVKYINTLVGSASLIQGLDIIVKTTGTPLQTSSSGRVVTLVTVSQGSVYYCLAGGTTWTLATGGQGALNSTGVVFSAANSQKLYFADGANYKLFDPSTNTVSAWTASAGTLPIDSNGNTPRQIATWRGRTVLSGLLGDPQNWFMSAVGDPTNFDYSPLSQTPTQAVAGNASALGLVGDVVTCLIPFTDDVLVLGGDHSIWLMNGDPAYGGQIDLVSNTIGMAWGRPYCLDPYGTIYFMSNRMGVYSLVPGQAPQRISQAIEQSLVNINTGTNAIRMIWNDRLQTLHVFVTPTAAPAACTHFAWEQRTGAWWQDTFANNYLNPICCTTFDGNLPGDRVPLIGSWDGYVRALDPTATDDDGTAIASSVVLGPFLTPDLDDVMLKDLQAVLGTGTASSAVTFAIYVGATAEAALASTPVRTGTWGGGRNLSTPLRFSGHAVWVKLSSSSVWAMESIRARVALMGKVRRRGG